MSQFFYLRELGMANTWILEIETLHGLVNILTQKKTIEMS